MFSQEHPNTTAVTEAPHLGIWTEVPHVGVWAEAPHAKKTDLAPLTLPAETEAPLVRAGSDNNYINRTALLQACVLKNWTETCCSSVTHSLLGLKHSPTCTETCCVVL